MTTAQQLTREIGDAMRALEPALGPSDLAGDWVRTEVERASRSVQALAALVGVPARVELTSADLRSKSHAETGRCPRCGEKLRLVPSCGFGASAVSLCGACGYEPS